MSEVLFSAPAQSPLAGNDFLKIEAWRQLNPALHIHDPEFIRQLQCFSIDDASKEALDGLMRHEGYVHLPGLAWELDIGKMAEAVTRVAGIGLNPAFAFVYDEFWLAFCKLHYLIETLLGGSYKLLPDFWVWRVDPRNDDSGWTPHRDKGHRSLFPDGSPKSLTIWIPLTDATPLNGCMYVVPAHRDPTYNSEREKEHLFALPDIRALPGKAGDAFIWNQAVLHWGAHSSTLAPEPRISMAFEFQRADLPPFNEPLMEPLQLLEFNSRLRLIGKQVLQYQHMYRLAPQIKSFAEACLEL